MSNTSLYRSIVLGGSYILALHMRAVGRFPLRVTRYPRYVTTNGNLSASRDSSGPNAAGLADS